MAQKVIVPKKEMQTPGELAVHKTFHSRMQVGRYAKQNGKRLVAHSTLNEGIMRTNGRISGNFGSLPICAAEIIAYVPPGESFKNGLDIVDAKDGTRIPWQFLQNSDVLGQGKTLIILPKDFEKYNGTGEVVVIPEFITVIGSSEERESFLGGEEFLLEQHSHQAVRTISRILDPEHGADAKIRVLATLPLNHDYGAVLEDAPKKESPPAAWQPTR
jgi:hypothetical protein